MVSVCPTTSCGFTWILCQDPFCGLWLCPHPSSFARHSLNSKHLTPSTGGLQTPWLTGKSSLRWSKMSPGQSTLALLRAGSFSFLLFSLYTNACTYSHPLVKLLLDNTSLICLFSGGGESAYTRSNTRSPGTALKPWAPGLVKLSLDVCLFCGFVVFANYHCKCENYLAINHHPHTLSKC